MIGKRSITPELRFIDGQYCFVDVIRDRQGNLIEERIGASTKEVLLESLAYIMTRDKRG